MNNLNYDSSIALDLLRQRDVQAFEALYDRYAPLLYGVILDFLQNEEKAADILQQVFEKVIKVIDEYNPSIIGMFAWLLQLTRNACLAVVDDNEGRVLATQQKYVGNGLRNLVVRMPEVERRIIELFYYSEHSLHDAAILMKLPESVVARLRLKTFTGLINKIDACGIYYRSSPECN